MSLLKKVKKFSKVVLTIAGEDDLSLGDTPITLPNNVQVLASMMEPNLNTQAATQGSEDSHQRHSSKARGSGLNDIPFASLVKREGTIIYGTDAEELDALRRLVKDCTFGTPYNDRFAELLDTAELVFLARIDMYNALESEGKHDEMVTLYERLIPFGSLLNEMHRLFSSCALNLAPSGKRVTIPSKKVEKILKELNSKLEGFIVELNKAVMQLNDDFKNTLNAQLAQTTTSYTPKKDILGHVVRTLQNSHSGLQPIQSQVAILDSDIVAEPEGRAHTLLEPSTPRRGQGRATQIMDRPLVDEPSRRQSTMQLSPSAPTAASCPTFQHNPSDTRSANRRESSQPLSQNGRSTARVRHTVDGESRRSDVSRAPKTSKTAPVEEYPAEETRSMRRHDTDNTTSRRATNERKSSRKPSRKGTHEDDLDEASPERRREERGDRPRRRSSGTMSAHDHEPRRRHRPRDSSIKEETEGPTEESSSEDNGRRRNIKKKSTHDREQPRHRVSDYYHDHDPRIHASHHEPRQTSSHYPAAPLPNPAIELVTQILRAQSIYAPSYSQDCYDARYHR